MFHSNALTDRIAGKALAGMALTGLALVSAPATLNAQYFAENTGDDISEDAPIARALAAVSDDVREFNDHVTFLAHPFLAGRLPGTQGMEIAKDYMEFYLKQTGLEPAFPTADGGKSYRQPFNLRSESTLASQSFSFGDHKLTEGVDWTVSSLGAAGDVTGAMQFVGYGIGRGPRPEGGGERYTNFADGLDLTGKVAVLFRFEPMDENGVSIWGRSGRWSSRAGFGRKLKAAAKAGASAILVMNPPGCSDERAEEALVFSSGRRQVDIPVVMLSRSAAERLAPHFAGGRTLADLRGHADATGASLELTGSVSINAGIEEKPVVVENVAGVLPGVGALADEWIVMGGHLDHLGMGVIGTSHRGKLHPGADDNATGAAGVIMLARMLRDKCAALPADMPRRSILFIGFTAEESGLNGARHYTTDPIAPLEKHALMCNFDMVGRIVNKRLLVAGAFTGTGLEDLLAPVFERSVLDVVQPDTVMMASDHAEFYRSSVPVLFSITADLNAHKDYHTPRDVAWKINRVDAVNALYLYRDILWETVRYSDPILFTDKKRADEKVEVEGEAEPAPVAAPTAPRGGSKVRFGIAPGNYDDDKPGVVVDGVSLNTSAEDGGVKVGDRLMTWNGDEITDIPTWMEMLREHTPGDVVKVGVARDGKTVVLDVTLKGRE